MKKVCRVLILFALVLWSTTGCSSKEDKSDELDQDTDVVDDIDDDVEDSGPFVIEDPYKLVPFQAGVDREDGHPDVKGDLPEAGEVRVGRLKSDETGFTGVWSHCRQGDFLLTNSKVSLCIQKEETNRYETYSGGILVDARQHSQPPGEDVLDMVFTFINFGVATGDKVEVVRDGSDGVAVLRVTGTDSDFAHLTGVLGMQTGNELGLIVETEYRLYPDTVSVEMVTVIRPPGAREFRLPLGDWFAYGSRSRPWTPGAGFGVEKFAMPWIGAFGEGHSFGLVYEDSATPLGFVAAQGIPYAEMRVGQVEMSRDNPAVYRRWFVIGDGTLDSIRLEAAALRGEELPGRAVAGLVLDDAGKEVSGAEVVFRRENGAEQEWVTAVESGSEGSFEAWLEPGIYEAEISNFSGPLKKTVEVEVLEQGDMELRVPQVATVKVQVREAETNRAITSRVRFVHEDHGSWHDYARLGELTALVPAGTVQVIVTRGMEYDIFSTTLELEPGQVVSESVELFRGLDTEGWRGADFHQHMEPSVDSEMSVYTRMLENASQGLELAVSTDHEVVTDLQPVIDALGLGDEISTFAGLEVSPIYAHFGLYPLEYQHDKRGRGSIPLAYREDGEVKLRRMPEIVAIARQLPSDPIVQMNHARNSSGMLNHVGFDPEVGPDAVDHEDFTIDIDVIEVINRYPDICQIAADWSGLLNAGYRITGLGNSDSHHPNGDAGAPRNFIRVDALPGEITGDMARSALRSGQVSVSSEAFIDFTDGTLPGDEVQVDGEGKATFNVRVQTPDWSRADKLFVIVNGRIVQEIDGDSALEDWVDFEETIEVEVEEDSWVVFWASGPRTTSLMAKQKEVIAFTNPVYLKTSGGDWQAPGVGPLDLGALDRGFCR